jgi:hypothetical protein
VKIECEKEYLPEATYAGIGWKKILQKVAINYS